MSKIGWGIIGPGAIVKRFMNDLPNCEGIKFVAVASRSIQKAKEFADEYGFERYYGSYEELLNDKDVDVVYVATPHPFHKDQAIMCMNAGKSVLCEKPVAVNKDEIVEMVECARRNNVFFMEAMWTRHFPVNRQVKELIDSGKLGKVTLIKADFGFGRWINGAIANKESRIFNMDLAGGALLVVGVYTVSYATWMKGQQPVEIKAMATKVETGADGMSTCLFKYQDGAMAMLESSVMQTTKQDAIIYLEKGYIEIKDFWHPTNAVVKFNDGSNDLIIEDNYDRNGGTGFDYEAQHVIDCMNEGLKESPYMTWQDSINVMETLDTIREQIDLVYPFENK
jgi:predicted dehydrogenase